MIIGIDATSANKEQKTGVEWYAYHLIRALSRQQTRHTYRLYFREEPVEGLKNLGPNIQYATLRWPLPYLWTQARLSYEMLINPPDVLFIPSQIIPFIHPSKTVTTLHDIAFRVFKKSYSLKRRFYLNLAAVLASRLPKVITISDFSRREIQKFYSIPEERVIVTPLGFISDVQDSSPMILTKHAIRPPYILSIGRLERKKNTSIIISAFNAIKDTSWGTDLQLVLAGSKGYGWNEIEQAIATSPYTNDIKLVGWVTESEKHSLLINATVFMLVSAYEGFGLPLLEAMHTGTPIVTSDQASLPEIAGDAALITPRGNVAALVSAVHTLITDQTLRDKLIESGQKRVTKFTWDSTARKTMDALETLAKS